MFLTIFSIDNFFIGVPVTFRKSNPFSLPYSEWSFYSRCLEYLSNKASVKLNATQFYFLCISVDFVTSG